MEKGQVKRRASGARRTAGPASFRSVLVGIDLTAGSDRVLGRVARLPIAAGARVTLVHVVPGSLPVTQQREAERDARKALDAEARHLRESLPSGIEIEPAVQVGSAAKEIAVRAKKAAADLIVMGRGTGRGLRDAFLGSTAERVIRGARIPVLVVRLPARAPYLRPALALDLDQAAHEIVRLLFVVVPPPRPEVAVIHALDTPYRGLMYSSVPRDVLDDIKAGKKLKATRRLAKLLAAEMAKAGGTPDDAPLLTTHVRSGPPQTVVEKATVDLDTDLLVLGTRGYSGAAYLFLGTVAGDLLRAVKCDVLVVPPARSRK